MWADLRQASPKLRLLGNSIYHQASFPICRVNLKLVRQYADDQDKVARRATTVNDDRYLFSFHLSARKRLQPLSCLGTSRLPQEHQFRVRVSRRLHERGLYAMKPALCIPLIPSRKRARTEWCGQHQNWTQLQWANVLFTDESSFSLQPDYGRLLTWR